MSSFRLTAVVLTACVAALTGCSSGDQAAPASSAPSTATSSAPGKATAAAGQERFTSSTGAISVELPAGSEDKSAAMNRLGGTPGPGDNVEEFFADVAHNQGFLSVTQLGEKHPTELADLMACVGTSGEAKVTKDVSVSLGGETSTGCVTAGGVGSGLGGGQKGILWDALVTHGGQKYKVSYTVFGDEKEGLAQRDALASSWTWAK